MAYGPRVLAALGVLLFLGGFLYDVEFAGIPYQDPTLDQTAAYHLHAWIAAMIRETGLCAILLASVAGVMRRAGLLRREGMIARWPRILLVCGAALVVLGDLFDIERTGFRPEAASADLSATYGAIAWLAAVIRDAGCCVVAAAVAAGAIRGAARWLRS